MMPPKRRISNAKEAHKMPGGFAFFDMDKMHGILSEDFDGTVDPRATAYFLGVMQYVAAEILEVSGNAAMQKANGRLCQITTEDIQRGIMGDNELRQLFGSISPPTEEAPSKKQ